MRREISIIIHEKYIVAYKSTLVRYLSNKLNINYYELDKVIWNYGEE